MASTKSLYFKRPYLRQNWSIPDSIIYSMTFNPPNAKAWQKLIQSCKYFFAKNDILVVDELYSDYNKKWEVVFFRVKNGEKTRISESINFKSALCKIWLAEKFSMSYYKAQPSDSSLVSSIIPYFYQCDITSSQILKQEITYDQFKFIFSKVESIILYNCVVRNKNDETVPFEKLVKALPNIEKIDFCDNLISSSITSNTVKEFLKIPYFSKLNEFVLFNIPEKFDLETFYIYFKKNKHTKFRIHFRDTISEAYKIRLEAIVDEIIATENHDYKIPFIYFGGLPEEKWRKINSLICQQNKQ